jgi:hypothetical protein
MDINDILIINENIIDYKYKFPTIDIIINYNTDINHQKYKEDKSYYFILDSNTSRDIGYWVFESFIFVSLLKDLNKTNSNIKIISKIKNYDIKHLLNHFNVDNEIINEIDNYNNICYSPKIYSIYYYNYYENDNIYNYFLSNYINYIKTNLDLNVNKYSYAFVNIDNNNEIIKKIKINANETFFIDNSFENIKYNLSIINNAKIIILLYDSSFYYNCIFLEKKFIIIIEDDIYRANGLGSHLSSNKFLDYLFKIISNRNKIKIMKFADVYSNIFK